jgi:3-vinyl bacteriochlorophyllide hydratase
MPSDPWNWPSLLSSNTAGGNAAIGSAHGRGLRSRSKNFISRSFNAWIEDLIDRVAPCPWNDGALHNAHWQPIQPAPRKPLYTAAERLRRDSTGWTLVQGILAPVQFAVFLVSLGLVLNYLATGDGYASAAISVTVKTLVLYAIMVTGAIWEKRVFGKYLFADAFFWEDAVSMLVIALHTAYLAAMLADWGTGHDRMILALAAYASYAVNATQFLLKLRAARLEAPAVQASSGAR